ncbi:hypothetical protein QJQ45_018040 [Haematococcus lacustris]|nr:hypothetical protein QJQ45_018040 [Haematococcus lacustris]
MVSSPIVAASSRLIEPAAFFRWGYAVLTKRFRPPGSSGYPRRFGFWRLCLRMRVTFGIEQHGKEEGERDDAHGCWVYTNPEVVEHAIALGTKGDAGQHQKDVLKLEHRGGDNMHQSVTLVVHASPLSRLGGE